MASFHGDNNAVICRDVHKTYGQVGKGLHALQGVNLTLPQGIIYGLLGPSGCGKTTLLRCMLGRLTKDQGEITVNGKAPGTAGHGVPGRMVGYMPQETALYSEFTIGETLTFFGRLHKMKENNIKDRIQFLLEFLDLPPRTRIIGQLSGGQQRRVSFAVALLHEPELLILDEPTVGVDPLLREKIWEHLMELTKSGHVTIIITTHYIEEARQAAMVGMMRSGVLLAESPPQNLIDQHKLDTLEAVFLKLCQLEGEERATNSNSEVSINYQAIDKTYGVNQSSFHGDKMIERSGDYDEVEPDEHTSLLDKRSDYRTKNSRGCGGCCQNCGQVVPSGWNLLALVIKDLNRFKRRPGFLIFQVVLPVIQVVLFCLAIGGTPHGLSVAIVNEEHPPTFSQVYLQSLNNHTISQVAVSHMDDAIDGVKQGHYWGIIHMGQNFSQDLIARYEQGLHVDNATINGSSIKVTLDMTNEQIAVTLTQETLQAYQKFADVILQAIGANPLLAQLPVVFMDPIYGSLDSTFTDFMAPGVILSITYFLAVGLTALSLIIERKEGLLDRIWVAGVSSVELMIGHIMTQFITMFLQITLELVFILAVFKVPCVGSLGALFFLTILQGLCGMAFGLLISAVCDDENSAVQASLGSFYPNMLLSGLIWPLEAIPYPLRYLSYCLPQTFATEALRCIMFRGWGLAYLQVWRGYLVTVAWGCLFLIAASTVIRLRK
ncbi:ABC transporter G family member 20-like [Glandiceps talaboti]